MPKDAILFEKCFNNFFLFEFWIQVNSTVKYNDQFLFFLWDNS